MSSACAHVPRSDDGKLRHRELSTDREQEKNDEYFRSNAGHLAAF
jgi:hypothetical protein